MIYSYVFVCEYRRFDAALMIRLLVPHVFMCFPKLRMRQLRSRCFAQLMEPAQPADTYKIQNEPEPPTLLCALLAIFEVCYPIIENAHLLF